MPLDRNHIDPIEERGGGVLFCMIRPPGIVIRCSLTPSALLAIGDDKRDSPRQAFNAHRDQIEAVASAKYDRGEIEPDGGIALRVTDFAMEATS